MELMLDEHDLAKFLRLWERIGPPGSGEQVFYVLKKAYA